MSDDTDKAPKGVSVRIYEDIVLEIPTVRIRRYKGQPRTHFDQTALGDLARSIKKHG